MVAGETLVTGHATAREPAEADTLPHFAVGNMIAHSDNLADDLVAGHKWIGRDSPFVIDHGEIGMTHAAVFDGDLNFVVVQGAGSYSKGLSFSPFFMTA